MRLEFVRPEALVALFLLPIWWWLVWPWAGRGTFFSHGESVKRFVRRPRGRAAVLLVLPRLLRSAALACLVVALAEPVRIEILEEASLQGKAIGLAVDISRSMLSLDMEGGRSRMDVAREGAVNFAKGRPLDEMTLIGFAGLPVTRIPPTRDAGLIVAGVGSLEADLVRDGTDISAAVLATVARLQESEPESRVVILLTDGAHNGDDVPPLVAARAAAALGVKVHAISILPPSLGETWIAEDMETVLTAIAAFTGGRYFNASTAAGLDSIYREINLIEAPVPVRTQREVRHPERTRLLLLGLLLLGLDLALRGSRWGLVP